MSLNLRGLWEQFSLEEFTFKKLEIFLEQDEVSHSATLLQGSSCMNFFLIYQS